MSLRLSTDSPVNIFWFRRDLRLEDNHGLHRALKSGLPVLSLFIFDTHILDQLEDKQDPRVTFIYQSLQEINDTLHKVGSNLLVLHGDPVELWQQLISEIQVVSVFTNHDYEPYAITRDGAVADVLGRKGISFFSYKDQVIFEKQEILSAAGRPYMVYTPYMRAWLKQLNSDHIKSFPSGIADGEFVKDKFAFPAINDLGFFRSEVKFPRKYPEMDILLRYDQTRNFPAITGTSHLGIHLRFGTVSIRELVRVGLSTNEVWLGELIWREFFMMILSNFPYVVNRPFREKFSGLTYLNDDGLFRKWCEGNTGYPLVDAGMRQLNKTGFMHNRVRMVVASFLTKHLLIDWRWGEKYFARKLLDFELASNNGNWQWVAGCGCDAAPYFRIFNPIEQARKFDPDQEYVRKWISEFGSDGYPLPIIEHKYARERALSFYNGIK